MGRICKFVFAGSSLLATSFLLQPYRPVIVRGDSMLPTLKDGSLVFSVPLDRDPRVGDIVIVDHDGSTIVKRVAMVEGYTYLETRPRRAQEWSIVTTPKMRQLVKRGKLPGRCTTIGRGRVFLLGDNAERSLDSRSFGTVPVSEIRGVVVTVGDVS